MEKITNGGSQVSFILQTVFLDPGMAIVLINISDPVLINSNFWEPINIRHMISSNFSIIFGQIIQIISIIGYLLALSMVVGISKHIRRL